MEIWVIWHDRKIVLQWLPLDKDSKERGLSPLENKDSEACLFKKKINTSPGGLLLQLLDLSQAWGKTAIQVHDCPYPPWTLSRGAAGKRESHPFRWLWLSSWHRRAFRDKSSDVLKCLIFSLVNVGGFFPLLLGVWIFQSYVFYSGFFFDSALENLR